MPLLPFVHEANLVYAVTYSPSWIILIVTLVYEFGIYPLIRNRLPSILKRIEIIFIIFLLNSVKLVLATAIFSCSLHLSQWSEIAYSVLFSSIFVFLLTSILEFVCAHAVSLQDAWPTTWLCSAALLNLHICWYNCERLFGSLCWAVLPLN